MKRIIHILLIAAVLPVGCSRNSFDPAPSQEYPPIEIGMSDLTKAVYNGPGDIPAGDGFVVWSSCTIDSESDPQAIFGTAGTKVYAPDWTYSPTRFWQRGTYSFAAALPASAFNAQYASTEPDKAGSANISGSFSETGALTLDFGKDADNKPIGFDLSANQIDLMVAFPDDVTYTGGDPARVSLNFSHMFSMVSIEAATTEPRTDMYIKEIKIYGNSSGTTGNMVFTSNGSTTTSTYVLTGTTSEEDVYKTITPSEPGWKLAAGSEYTTLIPGLLVFPEECPFCIQVTYADRYGKEFTDVGSLSASWEAGKKYTYSFTVSLENIAFAEPTVEPWPETAVEIGDGNIEM